MRISERKQRLRARGVVPVSHQPTPAQERGQRQRAGVSRGAAAPTTGGARRRQPRPLSPGYQIIFGGAYVVLAPILFFNTLAQTHAHPVKGHPATTPGTLEFALPILFFLFGLWWLYRGVTARRKVARAAQPAAVTTTTTTTTAKRLAKGPSR